MATLRKPVPTRTTPPAEAARSSSPARARILATADRLFYGAGIRAVGVDRIVAEAKVTRVTFYRHFPSKDHLIVAYIQARLDQERRQFGEWNQRHPGHPGAVLSELAAAVRADSEAPGFRGCPFLNLVTEYPDPGHPARRVTAEHRAWLLAEVTRLLTAHGHPRAKAVAEQLVMIRAGAMAIASVDGPQSTAGAFIQGWNALIDEH